MKVQVPAEQSPARNVRKDTRIGINHANIPMALNHNDSVPLLLIPAAPKEKAIQRIRINRVSSIFLTSFKFGFCPYRHLHYIKIAGSLSNNLPQTSQNIYTPNNN
jgi:hypothetical protein